jgi:Flp pilus assembly protein TadD
VTAAVPVLALLWDRTFVAGSFRAAWRARRGAYLGLFASWILIAALVATAGSRGGTVGFGSKVAWWDYALTQCEAIVHYVRLALWPSPLIFDYGVEWKKSLLNVAPQALLVVAMVAGTFVAVARNSAWGFLGLWFFAMLAPTSLIPGNRQTMAEHRMYLSLAAVLVVVVIGLFLAIDGRRKNMGWPWSLVLFAAIAIGLGWMTVKRNEDYRSMLALYRDTVEKRPGNADAHYNLANVLAETAAPETSLPEYEAACRLRPDFPAAEFNRGNVLWKLGRLAPAAEAFRAALRVKPDYARAHTNLGAVLMPLGRKEEAAEHFAVAARLTPNFFQAHENLGNALMDLGRLDEARAEFEQALRVQPASSTAHFGLGNVFFLGGKMAEAAAEYERAVQLNPAFARAREQLMRARQTK